MMNPGSTVSNLTAVEVLIQALPQPAIALDRSGRVVTFNEGARTVAPTLHVRDPLHTALRDPTIIDAFRQALETRQPQRIELVERVPRERAFEVFVTPLALDAVSVLLTFNDLTPLRRVEEMRADFVANASHELRTPLAALLGFIETLQGPAREDAASRDKFLAIMQTQAARMARLIDDLLSLSRIELNAHLRPETPIDLVGVVRQVVDGLQMLARDRHVAVNVSGDGPLPVLGDRDELIRAFENLAENALKYGAPGERVDISLGRGEGPDGRSEARVVVRDYGPGIAPEHLPRLTERFYRVDVVDSRAQGGTGLGLALVKHILSRHGGRMSIESTLGAGAAFTAYLPLLTAKAAEPSNSP